MVCSVCRRVLSNYYDGHDKSKNPVNHQKGRDGSMKRTPIVFIALSALVDSAVG